MWQIEDEEGNTYGHAYGWFCHGETIDQLMTTAIRGHLDCPKPDAILNIETHLYNVTLTADSCENNLDIGKEVWLNKGRWSRLMKEYVPAEPLCRFVDQAVEILTGGARDGATANMMFRDPERYTKKHRWGGCLMGATFRGDNAKAGRATLTFYSRTTYMGYMGLLDAGIATCIANEIALRYIDVVGTVPITAADIAFRWHISSQQLHCFKTLPYVYSQSDLFDKIESYDADRGLIDKSIIPPTWYHMAKWYCKVTDEWKKWRNPEKMLANEKYGPFKRIKRRWLEHHGHLKKHVPPSLTLDQVDFSKCV